MTWVITRLDGWKGYKSQRSAGSAVSPLHTICISISTPGAIVHSGAKVISYGAPVLPGSMMMLAYFDDGVPIMGVPGGALYKKDRGGILDLVLPRLAAGISMTKDDFVAMGTGGLCLGCAECHYPVCPYGKV